MRITDPIEARKKYYEWLRIGGDTIENFIFSNKIDFAFAKKEELTFCISKPENTFQIFNLTVIGNRNDLYTTFQINDKYQECFISLLWKKSVYYNFYLPEEFKYIEFLKKKSEEFFRKYKFKELTGEELCE